MSNPHISRNKNLTYFKGPYPEGKKAAFCLSFDVDLEYAYTKGTQSWGGLPRLLGLDKILAGSKSAFSRGQFGLHTGLPRIQELLAEYNVPATFFVPSVHIDRYPDVFRALKDAGHEIGAHGHEHESLEMFFRSPRKEKAILKKIHKIFEQELGEAPKGYRSPAWDMNDHTPRLLAEMGYKYDSSLFAGQAPYSMSLYDDTSSLVELPVDWSQDDAAYFLFLKPPITFAQLNDPDTVFNIWKRELEGVINEGGVFVLTCHPSIIGRHHRLDIIRKLIEYAQARDDVWMPRMADVAEAAASTW